MKNLRIHDETTEVAAAALAEPLASRKPFVLLGEVAVTTTKLVVVGRYETFEAAQAAAVLARA